MTGDARSTFHKVWLPNLRTAMLIVLCVLGSVIVATQAYVNLNFVIVDARTGGPLAGVTVTIDVDAGNGTTRQTDGGGFANFGVVPRTYAYTLTRAGYQPANGTIAVTGDTTAHGVLSPNPLAPGGFVATGSMTTPRWWHTATLLSDGRVLITGGRTSLSLTGGSPATDSAELYIPSARTFIPTGNMTTARSGHAATFYEAAS